MNCRTRNELPKNSENFLLDILVSRGIQDPVKWLNPTEDVLNDPAKLRNIDKGAELLHSALQNNWKIFLQVDSDTDGYTSSAIIYNFIKKISPESNIAYRIHEGKQHGVIVDTVPADTQLIILPDSSSNQPEEHSILRKMGMEILVIDHHEYMADDEDEAIIINNQDGSYPNRTLAGAGVTLKFCEYYNRKYHNSSIEMEYDLAALGIVADMMDLRNMETKYIIDKGLKNIKNSGFLAMVEKNSFSLQNRMFLNPIDISFYIAPMINALVRVGTQDEKELLFRAFIEGEIPRQSTKRGAKPGDIESTAGQAARIAYNAKARQQKLRDKAMEQLEIKIHNDNLLDNKLLVVPIDEEEVDMNLTGLIAMQLSAKYHKPTLLLRPTSDGHFRGSARGDAKSAIPDLKSYLTDTEIFEYAEGHANAFGVSIKKRDLEEFINLSNEQLQDYDFGERFHIVDYIFEGSDNVAQCVLQLGENEAWGQGVEQPEIAVTRMRIGIDDVTLMKSDSMKFTVNGVTYTTFRNPKACSDFKQYQLMDVEIVGRPNVNEYYGRINPQVFINDYTIKDGINQF